MVMFPSMEVPQTRWFVMENPIQVEDLGVPPFLGNLHMSLCESKVQLKMSSLMNKIYGKVMIDHQT